MSHTYFKDNTKFICNSDLSGDVTIKTKDGELDVNGKDIINFVVDYLRQELAGDLESMDNKDFIKTYLNIRLR